MAKGDKNEIINWEAREYVSRDRGTGWFIGLCAIGLVGAGIAIWQKQWTFAVLVVVCVVALFVYARREPRMLHYSLSNKGLSEGNRLYNFTDFKSFGVMNDDGNFSIILIPKKRFGGKVTVYFPEAKGEEIVDAFGARLPMETMKPDALDKIIKFLKI